MKLRVTKRGCFGRINGAVAELPVGYEFEDDEIPVAFNDRVIVLEQQSVEAEADKKKKGK